MLPLQAAGNAVKRASDNLVKAAQKAAAFEDQENETVVVKEKMVGGIAQVSLSEDTVGDSVTCTIPLPLPPVHIFLSRLALHPSDYRSTGRDASEGTRAGRGSEKARPDPAAAVQVLAFRASRRALKKPCVFNADPAQRLCLPLPKPSGLLRTQAAQPQHSPKVPAKPWAWPCPVPLQAVSSP